jgi:pSer/pThr/pTyr-binding forkhead associated (FHA) protein
VLSLLEETDAQSTRMFEGRPQNDLTALRLITLENRVRFDTVKAFVVLQAVSGPGTGRRIDVPLGSVVKVGRTAKSDCVLGEDAYLSGQHFSVECAGEDGPSRLSDLGSSNGTFLNGERIAQADIKDGDLIAAGGTTFTVHIERAAAAGLDTTQARTSTKIPVPDLAGLEPVERWSGFSAGQRALLNALFRDSAPVFGFLDPLRDNRIPVFLDASRERYERVEETLAPSPYLVNLPPRCKLLDVLIKDGWGRGWGFYFASTAGFDELRVHWRRYVILRNEEGREITFRFWDPRVLAVVLPSMQPVEAREFLGPIARLVVEGDRPQVAIEFSPSPRGVASLRHNLEI